MANTFQNEVEAPELETLANLAENLVYRLPGCDDTVVRKTLQEVAREFVSDTQCLTSRQRLEVDEGGMCFPAPRFGGKVAEVRAVWKFSRLLRRGIDWNWPVGSGLRLAQHIIQHGVEAAHATGVEPVDARRYTPARNVMGETPASASPMPSPFTALVVERLPLFFESLPRALLGEHGDAICAGALARLLSMTGRPWSDMVQAAQERTNYENAKSALRMKREMPADGRAIDMSEVL